MNAHGLTIRGVLCWLLAVKMGSRIQPDGWCPTGGITCEDVDPGYCHPDDTTCCKGTGTNCPDDQLYCGPECCVVENGAKCCPVEENESVYSSEYEVCCDGWCKISLLVLGHCANHWILKPMQLHRGRNLQLNFGRLHCTRYILLLFFRVNGWSKLRIWGPVNLLFERCWFVSAGCWEHVFGWDLVERARPQIPLSKYLV